MPEAPSSFTPRDCAREFLQALKDKPGLGESISPDLATLAAAREYQSLVPEGSRALTMNDVTRIFFDLADKSDDLAAKNIADNILDAIGTNLEILVNRAKIAGVLEGVLKIHPTSSEGDLLRDLLKKDPQMVRRYPLKVLNDLYLPLIIGSGLTTTGIAGTVGVLCLTNPSSVENFILPFFSSFISIIGGLAVVCGIFGHLAKRDRLQRETGRDAICQLDPVLAGLINDYNRLTSSYMESLDGVRDLLEVRAEIRKDIDAFVVSVQQMISIEQKTVDPAQQSAIAEVDAGDQSAGNDIGRIRTALVRRNMTAREIAGM